MNIDFKIGFNKRRSFDENETRYLRHNTFGLSAGALAGLATTAIGAGVSIYGANKQAKANQSAQDSNAALQEEQARSAWASYLMSRGVNPSGAKTGEIPTNPQAINAKLPLWASVSRTPSVAQGFRLGKAGGGRLALAPQNFQNTGTNVAASQPVAPVSSGKGSSNLNDVLIGNPLGIGGKNRTWYDPLGIF